jgi:WD40 repeat protein
MSRTWNSLSAVILLVALSSGTAPAQDKAGAVVRLPDTLGQGQKGGIDPVVFSPDGKILASVDDEAITFWEVASRKEIHRFKHSDVVLSIAFNPDDKTLVSGGSTAKGREGDLKLWDVSTGTVVRRFTGHSSEISSVAFSPDGKILASGSVGWRIRVWDVTTGKNTALFQGTSPILSLAFHPNGRLLAYGSTAGNFDVFDLNTSKRSAVLNDRTTSDARNSHTKGRLHVAFSPDGRILATGSEDKTIRLWDVATGKVAGVLKGHTDAVTCLTFNPIGKILASGSKDKTIRLWDLPTGKTAAVLQGHTDGILSVAISPDGKMLASGSQDGTIKLWDMLDAKKG